MEGCCLYRFRKTVNVRYFHDNGGGYVHQPNDTVRDFYLYISDSKLLNDATTTAHIYTLLARMFEKNKRRGGKFLDQTYGCAKQYRFSIAYYLMFFLPFDINFFLIEPLIHQIMENI